ncbi:MAG TPA: DUF58 domain-containing protein [Bryobacteraceae bacterium]|nr:DUF58 domain-containing protein [Bryobacteraceae bacterium]
MPSTPLLERQFLEKLERLTIHWQKSFNGLVGGHNRSRFAGGGQEFLDHRHFHHGDDLRAVNWRAYLRLEKMFLKMFQVEPRVPVRMLLDTSESMNSEGGAKFDYARRLIAALCYVGLVRLDTIVLQPFSSRLGEGLHCGGGRHRFSPVVEYLSDLKAGGPTNYLEVVRQFISSHPQRGLVVIISDFLDDAGCEKPLQYLADFGHELVLVQIWSEEDRTPPWTGELDLVDAETEARLHLQFDDAARDSYTRAFDSYSAGLQQLAIRNSGRYVGVSTTVPIEDIVFGALVRSRVIA